MLMSARFNKTQIIANHVERIDGTIKYCADLAKDPSNGFTKDRSMRRVGSFPVLTLMEYDRTHPGWYDRAFNPQDLATKQSAWKEFIGSEYAKPFMTVDKMVH